MPELFFLVALAVIIALVFDFGNGMNDSANAIATGLVNPAVVDVYVILGGLVGSIFWVYFTTYKGLPVSASHALIGGFVGAALVKAGTSSLIFSGITKVLIFIVFAPLLGMACGFIFFTLIMWIFRKTNPSKINKYFKKLQLISASSYAITHGANDAQKTMGIIADRK